MEKPVSTSIIAALLACLVIAIPFPTVCAAESATLVRGRSGPPPALRGVWRVVSQTVVPSTSGVQAFGENDPAVIGRELTVTSSSLRWTATAKNRNSTLSGSCPGAIYDGQAQAPYLKQFRLENAAVLQKLKIAPAAVIGDLSFICTGPNPSWGPPAGEDASIIRLKSGEILMFWYDNLVLQLRRVGQ